MSKAPKPSSLNSAGMPTSAAGTTAVVHPTPGDDDLATLERFVVSTSGVNLSLIVVVLLQMCPSTAFLSLGRTMRPRCAHIGLLDWSSVTRYHYRLTATFQEGFSAIREGEESRIAK